MAKVLEVTIVLQVKVSELDSFNLESAIESLRENGTAWVEDVEVKEAVV